MSVTHRDRPHPAAVHHESNYDLLRRLVGDVLLLINRELALATAEMKQHVAALALIMTLFLAGGFAAMIGLLLLANAGALAVARAIHSMVGGYLIVGAAVTVIGAVVLGVARSRLAKQSLTPTQTLDEIRRDVAWMTHEGARRSV